MMLGLFFGIAGPDFHGKSMEIPKLNGGFHGKITEDPPFTWGVPSWPCRLMTSVNCAGFFRQRWGLFLMKRLAYSGYLERKVPRIVGTSSLFRETIPSQSLPFVRTSLWLVKKAFFKC